MIQKSLGTEAMQEDESGQERQLRVLSKSFTSLKSFIKFPSTGVFFSPQPRDKMQNIDESVLKFEILTCVIDKKKLRIKTLPRENTAAGVGECW